MGDLYSIRMLTKLDEYVYTKYSLKIISRSIPPNSKDFVCIKIGKINVLTIKQIHCLIETLY